MKAIHLVGIFLCMLIFIYLQNHRFILKKRWKSLRLDHLTVQKKYKPCVCVKGWGMNQHLSLAVGMVVGLVLVWEKLNTPAGSLIYCNSRALGHRGSSCTWTLTYVTARRVHGRLSLRFMNTLLMQLFDAYSRDHRCSVFCFLQLDQS